MGSSSSASGLWVRHQVELGHALLVLEPVGLHARHGLAPGLEALRGDDLPRVLEHRLDHRHHVERVRGALGVEQVERRERERCQRLVQRELRLEVDGDAHRAAVLVGDLELLDHAGVEEGRLDLGGARGVAGALGLGLVVVGEQAGQGGAPVAGPVEHVHQHRVADGEARRERFGRGGDQAVERGLPPRHHAGRRLLADHASLLAGVVAGLGEQAGVLDDVLGCRAR